MDSYFQLIERELTPGEAEACSGVSTTLQRDWRRRGILPAREGKQNAKFGVHEVVRMAVMKAFSDSGIEVKGSRTLANGTSFLADAILKGLPGVTVIEGPELSEEEMRQLFEDFGAASDLARYVFAPLPGGDEASKTPDAITLNDLSEIEALMEAGPRFHGLIIDMLKLAKGVADKAPLPLYRFVPVQPEEEE